jgi:hypothetical protein
MTTINLKIVLMAIIAVCLFLIFADLCAGMCAARKRGETINSAGIRRTVTKIFVYQLAIITGFVIEKFIIGNALPLNKVVGAVIAISEAKSVFENLNYIHGGDVFKKVIKTLGSINDKMSGKPAKKKK